MKYSTIKYCPGCRPVTSDKNCVTTGNHQYVEKVFGILIGFMALNSLYKEDVQVFDISEKLCKQNRKPNPGSCHEDTNTHSVTPFVSNLGVNQLERCVL